MATATALLLLAADEGPGRGDNPSGVGGVLIIAGIIAAVVLAAAVGVWLVTSLSKRRRGDPTRESGEHPPDGVGRL